MHTDEAMQHFLAKDRKARRPATLRLIGRSLALLDNDGSGEYLREKCAAQLAAGPLTAAELRSARYGITVEQRWQACVSSVLCTGRCPDPLLPARSTARGRVLLRGETSGTVWCATEDRAGQGVAVLEHREMPDSAKVFQLGIRHRLVLVR